MHRLSGLSLQAGPEKSMCERDYNTPSCYLGKSPRRPGMWQGYPCRQAQRGHWVKLWRWGLDYVGHPRTLELPGPWDTYWGKPPTWGGTSSREASVLPSLKLKRIGDLKSITHGDAEFGVRQTGFLVLLWFTISALCSHPYSLEH